MSAFANALMSGIPSFKFAILSDSKAEGTNGGASASNAYTSLRVINTVSFDPWSLGITLDTNKFTIPIPGNYIIAWRSPFFQVADFQTQLYKETTTAAAVAYGSNGYSGAGDTTQSDSIGFYAVELTAATEYSIRYHAGAVVADNGLGVTSSGITVVGHTEIYTQVLIGRLG